jgi:hypothetical protein
MDLATRDADAAFAELICADAQWLREEFDALIAASFSQPPAAPPPAPPRVPPPRGRPGPPSRRLPRPGPPALTPPVTTPGQRRQRSPPASPPTPGSQATAC